MAEDETHTGHALRGELQSWLAGPATLEDGWVVLDLSRAREYPPLAGVSDPLHDPHHQLADLKTPADAVAFVQRHGLLRHGPGADEHRERLSDFESEGLQLRNVLRVNVELRRAVSDDHSERVEGLQALRSELHRVSGDDLALSSDADVLERATRFVATVISDGLTNVELTVSPALESNEDRSEVFGTVGAFMLAPHVPNLLGLAYYRVALEIVERRPMRTCEECARVFPVHDQRQRFCTTRCANRARYHRFEERQAKGGKS